MPSWCCVTVPNFISLKILGWEIELDAWSERVISKPMYIFNFSFILCFGLCHSFMCGIPSYSFQTSVCDAFPSSKTIEIEMTLVASRLEVSQQWSYFFGNLSLKRDVSTNSEAKYGLRARLLEEVGCCFCMLISKKPVILDMLCVCFCWSAKLRIACILGERQGVVSNNMKEIIYLTWKCLDLRACVQNTHEWKMQGVHKLSLWLLDSCLLVSNLQLTA